MPKEPNWKSQLELTAPDYPGNLSLQIAASQAISLKRIADELERARLSQEQATLNIQIIKDM